MRVSHLFLEIDNFRPLIASRHVFSRGNSFLLGFGLV